MNHVRKNPFLVGSDRVEGFRLPLKAVHPITRSSLDVYVSNYVLADYGEGAVMGVPGHDSRDHAFAEKYGLECMTVVDPETQRLIHSGAFSGMSVKEGTEAILKRAAEEAWGHSTTRYRLRDWLVSRQRYWGAPVPAIHCPHCGVVPVPVQDLPVRLPEMSAAETNKMAGDDAVSPLGRRDVRSADRQGIRSGRRRCARNAVMLRNVTATRWIRLWTRRGTSTATWIPTTPLRLPTSRSWRRIRRWTRRSGFPSTT